MRWKINQEILFHSLGKMWCYGDRWHFKPHTKQQKQFSVRWTNFILQMGQSPTYLVSLDIQAWSWHQTHHIFISSSKSPWVWHLGLTSSHRSCIEWIAYWVMSARKQKMSDYGLIRCTSTSQSSPKNRYFLERANSTVDITPMH